MPCETKVSFEAFREMKSYVDAIEGCESAEHDSFCKLSHALLECGARIKASRISECLDTLGELLAKGSTPEERAAAYDALDKGELACVRAFYAQVAGLVELQDIAPGEFLDHSPDNLVLHGSSVVPSFSRGPPDKLKETLTEYFVLGELLGTTMDLHC